MLSCLLAGYAEDPGPFIFRGGTALARTHWLDYRLSEDLDLIAESPASDLAGWMRRLVEAAGKLAGVPLQLKFGQPNDGWSRSYVGWGNHSLVVDVNMDVRTHLPVERRLLDLPYDDLRGRDLTVSTVALPEILGNKWLMIEDRKEPRDLFDVWWAVSRGSVQFATIAAGHRAKYGFSPVRQILSTAEKRLRGAWEERLAHQLHDLPEFDLALAEVGEAYDRWEEAGEP